MPNEPKNPMDAMMDVFMVETNDFLSKLEALLLENEHAEDGIKQATPEIFRIMHTIKSSSAMMSLSNISALTHKVEDLFFYLREHKDTPVDDSRLADIVLDAVDFIKRNLDGSAQEDPAERIAVVTKYLDELKSGVAKPAQPPSPPEAPAAAAKEAPAPPAKQAPDEQAKPLQPQNKSITIFFRRETQMLGLRALELINRVRPLVTTLTAIPDDVTVSESVIREKGLVLLVQTTAQDEALREGIEKSPFVGRIVIASGEPDRPAAGEPGARAPQQDAPMPDAPVRQYVERRRDSPSFGKTYANVEITKLDNLVDLVGEILILQMELARDIEQRDFVRGEGAVVNLKKLILNLQEATLSTRMIPIRETFLKMNRLVRDMGRKQNKAVDFITSGEDTEVDRSIIENISSPLMHIIRNSIDHGIEDAATRTALGKPEAGRIELSAYTEGRNVVISVTDDGKGFALDKILTKAIDSGLVTEAEAQNMSEDEIYALVFLPGFSTNQEVTEYSGRGVGMDVVNENMKKMNGKVLVHSQRNRGTRVMMKIPLTLAIIDTVILRVGTETCAIPVSFVDKILFMSGKDTVRNVNGEDVVLLDDTCYRILNLFDFYTYIDRIPYGDGIMIVVGDDTRKYVVFASEILDRQDVVVKPAPALFKSIKGISGCTILGDGRISLILDTDELMTALNKKRSNQP